MCYLYFRLRKKMTEFNFSSIKYYPITFKPNDYYLWTMRYSPDTVYNLSICESQNDLRSWDKSLQLWLSHKRNLLNQVVTWASGSSFEHQMPGAFREGEVPEEGNSFSRKTVVKTRAGPGEDGRGAKPRLSTVRVTLPRSPTHNTESYQCQGLAWHGICWLHTWALLPLQRET